MCVFDFLPDTCTCTGEGLQAVQQVRGMVEKNYDKIQSAFEYYAAMGSGSPFHIQLNSYTTFLEDCSIPDPESQGIKRSDCDTVFIVANYLQDKKGKLYEVNDEHALMRCGLWGSGVPDKTICRAYDPQWLNPKTLSWMSSTLASSY